MTVTIEDKTLEVLRLFSEENPCCGCCGFCDGESDYRNLIVEVGKKLGYKVTWVDIYEPDETRPGFNKHYKRAIIVRALSSPQE